MAFVLEILVDKIWTKTGTAIIAAIVYKPSRYKREPAIEIYTRDERISNATSKREDSINLISAFGIWMAVGWIRNHKILGEVV